jgi:hypothetical protein
MNRQEFCPYFLKNIIIWVVLCCTLDGKSLLVTAMNRDGVGGFEQAYAIGRNDSEFCEFLHAPEHVAIAALMSGSAALYGSAALGVPFDRTSEFIAASTNFRLMPEKPALMMGLSSFPNSSSRHHGRQPSCSDGSHLSVLRTKVR